MTPCVLAGSVSEGDALSVRRLVVDVPASGANLCLLCLRRSRGGGGIAEEQEGTHSRHVSPSSLLSLSLPSFLSPFSPLPRSYITPLFLLSRSPHYTPPPPPPPPLQEKSGSFRNILLAVFLHRATSHRENSGCVSGGPEHAAPATGHRPVNAGVCLHIRLRL